jgi:signal transduction histidine kinase
MEELKNIRYINKGLAVLLATLFFVTILATVFLSKTLIDTRSLITNGTNTVSAVFLLQDLELNLRVAESSQRGYVITGDPQHIEDYNTSIKVIPEEQKALNNSRYDINASERNSLNNLIDKRLKMLQSVVDTRKSQGADAAMEVISRNKGLETNTQLDKLSKSIMREKFEPFTSTYQQTQHSLKEALLVAGTLVGFVLIISLFLVSYFQRTIARERATEGVKSEFLSLASHQLRTPASNVKQYLGLLLEGYLGKLKPEQMDAIKVANRNNDMGINIINELLGVAKLDLDKIHLKRKPANIYLLVKEVADDYRPQLRERKQTVKFERAVKKAEVYADTYYLKSVFENLLDNASKYSPKKTKIHVRVEQTSKKILVSIKDEGIGIRNAEKSKLFKKFSRIPSEATHNIEGSGLGLYWVKRIVELHGGKITVRSRYGKGATFIVELPNLNVEP